MFSIEIIATGKLSQRFLREGCEEYQKRAQPFFRVAVTELPEQKPLGDHPADLRRVTEAEGERMLRYLQRGKGPVAALAVEGERMSSEAFSGYLLETAMTAPSVRFLIGGALGLSDRVKAASGRLLSLSGMTFPHQLSRLILLEQIYRAAAIQNGIAYHK